MLTALYLPHIQCLTIYGRDGRVTARGETAVGNRLIEYGIDVPPNYPFDRREPCHGHLHYARVRLACPRCEGRLSREGPGLQLLPLPGAHWQELVDCWSCHRSEFAVVTTRLSWDNPTGQLLPRPTCALLGGFWLTVCAVDLLSAEEEGHCSCSRRREHWQRLGEEHWRVPLSELLYEPRREEAAMAASDSKGTLSLSALVRDELHAIWDTLCTRKVNIGRESLEDDRDARAGQLLHLECLSPRALIYQGKHWREGALIRWRANTENLIPLNTHVIHNNSNHDHGPGADTPLLRWPQLAYDQLVASLGTSCPIPLATGWESEESIGDYQVAFLAGS